MLNTCAGASGKTLRTLYQRAQAKGFKVITGFTLFAPESYPPYIVKEMTKENNPSPKNLTLFKDFVAHLNGLLAANKKDLKEVKLTFIRFKFSGEEKRSKNHASLRACASLPSPHTLSEITLVI